MKSVLIIGAGRFGRHMARKMSEMGNEVMVIDKNEERVNAVLDYVTHAQIGDTTNEHYLASLGVRNFDLCVVTIGENFQNSLETTSLLKELGAKFVLARATREVHSKFLLRNGADQVVYAEKEMAERAAITYASDSVFDYVELTPEYAIYEIVPPQSWLGKSILQKDVRNKYHVSILAVKRGEDIFPQPRPDYVFNEQERLIILGHNDDVQKLIR